MDRTERFKKIDRLLRTRSCVPIGVFLDELEVSRATFKRDLEYMRSRLYAPIAWDRERNGYHLTATEPDSPRYELPGLWFNSSEVYALLTMQHLLSNLEPGILAPHLKQFNARLRALLDSTDHSLEEIEGRIRILHMANRALPLRHFEAVAGALLGRRRLLLRYYARASGEETERTVSPQRLVHYRDNWYLDAWCHLRDDLRSFSVDGIRLAEVLPEKAMSIAANELDEVLGSGYGIFSGRKVAWAKLRFTSRAARWVAAERWHPQQKSRFEDDGSYILEVPYSDDRELTGDILRHGAEVEVLAPAVLRRRVAGSHRAAAQRYGD